MFIQILKIFIKLKQYIMKIQEEAPRKYQKIDYQTRTVLIHKVQIEKMKIKYAGEQLGLNQSTAKRIVKKYRTEGTITKFKKEKRNKVKIEEIQDERSQIIHQVIKKEEQKLCQIEQIKKEDQSIEDQYRPYFIEHYICPIFLPIWNTKF